MMTPERRRLQQALAHAAPFETPVFECLDFAFTVRTNDAELASFLATCYEHHPAPPADSCRFDFIASHDARRFRVYANGARVLTTTAPSIALSRLIWEINRGTEMATKTQLLLHAGAVAHEGTAVLFPAAQGSGKSTLVTALTRAGYGYLTDEMIAYDAAGHRVRGATKPITLKTGSWPVLPELAPRVSPRVAPYFGFAWQVAPALLATDSIVHSARPGVIVVPRYESGARTRLVPIGRAATAMLLSQQSFNFHGLGIAALGAIADLVRACDCYELVLDDLADACRVIDGLFERNASYA